VIFDSLSAFYKRAEYNQKQAENSIYLKILWKFLGIFFAGINLKIALNARTRTINLRRVSVEFDYRAWYNLRQIAMI